MLFKKKCYAATDEPVPYDIPATYGAEYDEYDYFYTNLPSDSSNWEHYYEKCQSCGKHHWFNKVDTYYFYSLDGYDSMSYTECWKCRFKSKISGMKSKFKKKIKQHKEYRKWIKMFKEKNIPITKELKESTKNICR